jgi:hypothetical protein
MQYHAPDANLTHLMTANQRKMTMTREQDKEVEAKTEELQNYVIERLELLSDKFDDISQSVH